MNQFLSLILCFALVSCAFKREDDSAKPKSTEEVARELRDQEERQLIASKMTIDQFKVRIEPRGKPNEFQLLIEWDKQNLKAEFSAEIAPGRSLTSFATQSPFVFPVQGGDLFNLSIKAYTLKDVLVFNGSQEISVPRDYVVGSSFVLSANKLIQAPRVFISKGVTISTLNYQLNIVTDKLVIEEGGATIENYSLSDVAAYQTPGQNGGSVIIKAKSARGTLFLRPRGQTGGHGLNGAVFPEAVGRHPGCAPGSGANGGAGGAMLLDVSEDEFFNPVFYFSPSPGGAKGIRGVVYSGPPGGDGTVRLPPCDRDDPDTSTAGAPGPTGTVCFISSTPKHQGCLTQTP